MLSSWIKCGRNEFVRLWDDEVIANVYREGALYSWYVLQDPDADEEVEVRSAGSVEAAKSWADELLRAAGLLR